MIYLVYRVFVIGFEFIESDDMPDSEEDEEGGEDKGDDVAKSGESERHLQSLPVKLGGGNDCQGEATVSQPRQSR